MRYEHEQVSVGSGDRTVRIADSLSPDHLPFTVKGFLIVCHSWLVSILYSLNAIRNKRGGDTQQEGMH